MTMIIPPGRNATLAKAWAAHKAAQKAEGKAVKHSGSVCESAQVGKSSKHAKPPRAKGGKPSKGK